MQLNIKIDSKEVENKLHELGEGRQAAFILSRSLNLIAKEIQKSEKQNIKENLNINRNWVLSQVKINPGQWATKKRLRVTIEVSQAANFLAPFEIGQEHIPINGHKFLAIPNKKVFGKKAVAQSNSLNIKNLNLQKVRGQLRGNDDTFLINSKSGGTPLIMQRVAPEAKGKGRRGRSKATGLRILYTLVKESKRPKKIQWKETASNTFNERWSEISMNVLHEALSDIKPSFTGGNYAI